MNPSSSTPPKVSTGEALFKERMDCVMASVDRHHRYLEGFLFGLTGQKQDAQDILQDLWRYVTVHFPYDKIQTVSWLRRKAYLLFLDRYRGQKRRREVITDTVPEQPVPLGAESGFSREGEAALKASLWEGFPGIDLTEKQKEALWQHARYGYTFQELQDRLGVPASTIGDWVTLGRRRMAEYLNQH